MLAGLACPRWGGALGDTEVKGPLGTGGQAWNAVQTLREADPGSHSPRSVMMSSIIRG